MSQSWTRARFRDEIRYCMGITPPAALGVVGAKPGDQPSYSPRPTNAEINSCLELATNEINSRCKFHVAVDLTIAVSAVSSITLGPSAYDLSSVASSLSAGYGTLNSVRRVVWDAGTSAIQPFWLQPTSREDRNREGQQYDSLPPATPEWYWIEGYSLYMLPSPSVAGTLRLIGGTALTAFINDLDTIDQLPYELHSAWLYWCVAELSGRQTQDSEAMERVQNYGPRAEGKIVEIQTWKNGGSSPAYQPSFSVQTYRRGSIASPRRGGS